uniref:C2H2-type domain-containing protein n=1 Tax=Salvator merianae TaxID=96440 RepID=A0A8D0BI76_SALMN
RGRIPAPSATSPPLHRGCRSECGKAYRASRDLMRHLRRHQVEAAADVYAFPICPPSSSLWPREHEMYIDVGMYSMQVCCSSAPDEGKEDPKCITRN